jgi:hypothetical protein
MSEYRNWVRTYAGLLTSSSGTAGVAPALSLRCQNGAAGPGRPEGGRGSWALVSGDSARRFSTSEPECPEGAEGMPPPAPGCSMRPAARRGGLGTVTSGSAVTSRGAGATGTCRSRRVVARVLVPARLRPHAAALSSDPGLRTAALAQAGSPPPTRSGCLGRLRRYSLRRCRSVYNSALARGEGGCGTHLTLLSLVACTRQLYPSTRRRVSSATPRAVPRFLPELLLHSPLAEKGQ